ncbi:hypothetical protein KSF_051060 [Reticulibacter mediterranei]|uniref:Yip1 domain-containing protein n=1 Tax=Reticulibacter mediterranei TaxID=2778369 RepID=A0A8J3IJU6_9CHLR|nr:Yip1 family protein [Reticulibacter mediterranei]GHO95058.1 hypothetical protein KSF_051060 [Reticulibacter mediterranei]
MSIGPDPENNFGTPVPPPPPQYGMPVDVPPVTPLPLSEAIRQLPDQYVRVVTRPGAATFAQEQGKASWDIVWVQLAIFTVISVIANLVIFNVTMFSYPGMNTLPQGVQIMRSFSGVFPLSYIILTPLSFFIGTGIYHLIAKAFGGQGTFLAYCYSYMLFYVPLGVVSLVLSMIPFLKYLGFAVSIYEIVLLVFMTMAVHRLSGGKATLAVLILPIALIVLACVIGAIAVGLMMSTHR